MARSEAFDQIRLRNWSVQAQIGAYDHEQLGPQELVLDLTLEGDFSAAGLSDRLADALDYAEFRGGVDDWIATRRWQLLEAFGEQLCAHCLNHPLVRRVTLSVDKPAAQAPVMVSYTLTRSK